MLDCYISAFHLISASEWDQVHGIVKFCENATFYNSSDAKEAFCSPQGFQTITQFNGCINDRLNGTGLNATVITPDKDFMLKVYKCLIVALDGNVSTEIPMTTTDDGTDEGSHSFSLSPKDEEPKETTQCFARWSDHCD
ncbi:hypothetical protein HDE_09707 [Halotydeus destructor]|nr:hypothetical protein HDE_09707 [Halotydeus destructor]